MFFVRKPAILDEGSSLLQSDPILIEFIRTDCFPIRSLSEVLRASLVAQMVKKLPAMQETRIRSPGGGWHPTPGFLLGESHGQRSLASYSPWGLKESDMTDRLTLSLRTRISIYLFFGDRGNTIQPTTKII